MEEARQHPALSGHPDARTFAAERLMEGERMALATAAGPLALLVTQIGTLAGGEVWVRGLATLSFACFCYCCVWQVHILNYATYWLAGERLGRDEPALAGRGLVRAFRTEERFTEEGLVALIRRSTWHYSVAYWIGAGAGVAGLLGVLWA